MNATKSPRRNVIIQILAVLLASMAWTQQPASVSAAQQSASAVPALPVEIPASAERYSYLITGNLAGQEAVWIADDKTLHIFFQFNDRGRGPKTTAVLKLGPDGIPISEVITGNDYMKSAVTEDYSLEAGTALEKRRRAWRKKNLSPSLLCPAQRGTIRDCTARPCRSA